MMPLQLKDPALFRTKAYINGLWVDAAGQAVFPVLNPANGEQLTAVSDCGVSETEQAIAAAHAALGGWRKKTAAQRGGVLRRWHDLILEHAEDLADIMTAEQGKPISEARGEVRYGASFIEWFAEEGKRVYGDIIPPHGPNMRLLVTKQPIGVVGAITPWNFPNAMITRKVAPALAAGCTVVIKPSDETPLSALALAELAERAGMPPGVLNVVTGKNAPAIGKALTDSSLVRKLSFTGSTAVGKMLMRQCADTVKKISLELGGNAPFIVFDDADVDAAIEGVVASKFRNAGQTCVCANRIFVQDSVYDLFLQKFAATVEKQQVGPGAEQGNHVGPLINQKAFAKVDRLVHDAVSKGARVLAGGRPHALGGTFYEPTVLADVSGGMDILEEEIFGPVAPVMPFSTEAEVIQMANDTPYGLAAYFYGRDIGRVFRVAEALEYGMVGVNTGILGTAVAPFGGMKESGIGREGSKYGIEEFLEIKYVCVAGL
ncbi:MAG: NAD-dependent succinate-semialdehyde dehydrogenase [Saprospiraceae bacterium]